MRNNLKVLRNFRLQLYWMIGFFELIGFTACGAISVPAFTAPISASTSAPTSPGCAPSNLSVIAGSQGFARVFVLDPISASGQLTLPPTSTHIDDFATSVPLSHLSGEGVLSGKYVSVVNNKECQVAFGAYDPKNQFSYAHDNWRFQESMAYYFGDSYRSNLDKIGYLQPPAPVTVVTHCMDQDNAYFERDTQGSAVFEFVCLGDSVTTQGASYGDDGIVTVHELEHATTMDSYSPVIDLNQFGYDEAGSLNEGISDFIGLVYSDSVVSDTLSLDPRIFSRWALGTFDPKSSHLRGANKCPMYDTHYPNCDHFPNFEIPSNANGNTTSISYVYPDGMGWPYPNNYKGSTPATQAYEGYGSQEEIHNADEILVGALWDMYTAVRDNHSGDKGFANRLTTQLVLESVRHLPLPDTKVNHSPVTFIAFAATMESFMSEFADLTADDRASILRALTARGLLGFPVLSSTSWMDVGPGTNFLKNSTGTPGVFILDDPHVLQHWLGNLNRDPAIVTQTAATGLNSRLDPGETDVIWFDLENTSNVTAGGVLVSVTSEDPDIVVLDDSVNGGFMNLSGRDQAQVMYGKINGTDIVSSLNPTAPSPAPSNIIPMGNTYFSTNPLFNRNSRTAIWVKVSPSAEHGKIVNLLVQATPSNGVTATQSFPVTIN